ncbi:MAG: DUF1573 domain-containing protein [Gemmataceae bacterium]|nr:DUF1573 domain-containing protein [Gemmataceae bacterium]
MRIAVLTVIVLAHAASSATAQSPWANKLFGNELSHDFGTVARGTQLKHSFKMTNIYKVPLQITEVRTVCNCVTATVSTKLLQPNETGYLHVNMDAARFNGPKTVTIYVTVGPDYVSTAALTVTANARQDVVFNPGEIDFGVVAKGQAMTKSIDVEHAGDPNWRVTEIVKSGAAPFDLKVEQLPQKVGGFVTVGYRITATLRPDAVQGSFKHEVILKTNDPQTPVISFNVLGTARAALQVAPNPVNLGNLKVGSQETTKFVVSGSRPFRITGIDGLDASLTVALPDAAKSTHILELRATPQTAGTIRRQLTVRTDLDGETATFTVEGTVVP